MMVLEVMTITLLTAYAAVITTTCIGTRPICLTKDNLLDKSELPPPPPPPPPENLPYKSPFKALRSSIYEKYPFYYPPKTSAFKGPVWALYSHVPKDRSL